MTPRPQLDVVEGATFAPNPTLDYTRERRPNSKGGALRNHSVRRHHRSTAQIHLWALTDEERAVGREYVALCRRIIAEAKAVAA